MLMTEDIIDHLSSQCECQHTGQLDHLSANWTQHFNQNMTKHL